MFWFSSGATGVSKARKMQSYTQAEGHRLSHLDTQLRSRLAFRKKRRATVRQTFYLLVHHLNIHNSRAQGQAKTRPLRTLFRSPTWVARTQTLEFLSSASCSVFCQEAGMTRGVGPSLMCYDTGCSQCRQSLGHRTKCLPLDWLWMSTLQSMRR